jgi:hypothetical protein
MIFEGIVQEESPHQKETSGHVCWLWKCVVGTFADHPIPIFEVAVGVLSRCCHKQDL